MNRRQGRVLRGTPLVAGVQTADLWNGDHTVSRRRLDWTGKGCIDAGTTRRQGQRTSECQYLSLEATLSWAVSDADRGMTACTTPVIRKSVPRELSSD